MKKISELLVYTDDGTSDYSLSQEGVESINYTPFGPFIAVNVTYTDDSQADFLYHTQNITFMEVVTVEVPSPPLPPPPPPAHDHPATPPLIIGGING